MCALAVMSFLFSSRFFGSVGGKDYSELRKGTNGRRSLIRSFRSFGEVLGGGLQRIEERNEGERAILDFRFWILDCAAQFVDFGHSV